MADQLKLIEIFKDTLEKCKSDQKLIEYTKKMQAGTSIYLDGFVSVFRNEKSDGNNITVVGDTTFSCAKKNIAPESKTAVLNFANAFTPGGSVKEGYMAQEECLCRSSNLYEALTMPYIYRNYYKWHDKNAGDMASDRIIYSKDVTVFKNDNTYPEYMEEWFNVDIITCAAPYYDKHKKKPVTKEKLQQVFTDRIKNILEVAAANDIDVLILGAFGCGAFNNPPEMVAEIFRLWLVEKGYAKCFKKVIFAIKNSDGADVNFDTFTKVFTKQEIK